MVKNEDQREDSISVKENIIFFFWNLSLNFILTTPNKQAPSFLLLLSSTHVLTVRLVC